MRCVAPVGRRWPPSMVLSTGGGCRALTGPTAAVGVVLLLQLRHNGLPVHLRLPLAQPSILAFTNLLKLGSPIHGKQ